MKKTLLQMVQSILSDMDSQDVNSIGDSVEAQQIASVIEDTYYNLIASRTIPENQRLIKLTSLSQLARPTHFTYPNNVKSISEISYQNSAGVYTKLYYVDPTDFLSRMPATGKAVVDVLSTVPLFIKDNANPTYYTTFDEEYLIFDAYDASIESTLQESKVRALGVIHPTFLVTDEFEPDLDDHLIAYLLAESKSICFSLFKNGSDPKVDQSARRLKSMISRDQYKTKMKPKRPLYGR